jgi:serine/threonine-protein kinase
MQLGAYTTVRRLGAGGMGEVYLAQHRHLARRAAVKVLLPEISSNEELVARFFNEARATSSLRHPSIVEVFDCDVLPNGQAYIVMEFLEGESLAATLRRSPDFRNDVRRLAAIAGQIADALQVAHAQNIIHRDLKPDNVFLAVGAGFPSVVDVKLLDFGIAKLIDDKGSKTRTGSLLGTPLYMSPEQCRGAGLVDHRTDIYSLGCMMFEMLCGRPPFVHEGAGELLVAHIAEAPPLVTSLRPDVPPVIASLVAAMLEKDPGARPSSLHDVLGLLEKFLGVPASLIPALVAPPAGFPVEAGAPRTITPVPRQITPVPRQLTPAPRQLTPSTLGARPAAKDATLGARPAVKDTTLGASVSVLDAPGSELELPRSRLRAWHVLLPLAGAAAAAAVLLSRGGSDAPAPQATATAAPAPPAVAPAAPAPPAPVTVNVKVDSTPEGAEVWLPDDAQPRGRTPINLELPRGESQQALTVKAPGYADAVLRVDRSKDGAAAVALTKLSRAPERRTSGKTLDTRERNKKTGSAVKPVTNPASTPSAPYRAVGD